MDISTNERIVPSVICNATSSITMNSASISRSSLVCQYGKSLHRIKVHTSNEAQSGTSSKILFGLKLKEKTTDMVLHECRSLLLSNHGSEFIRGQIDHFFSNDFGMYLHSVSVQSKIITKNVHIISLLMYRRMY